MTLEKTVFIVNPASSSGRTVQRFEALRPLVYSLFSDVEIHLTQRPLHATEIAQNAIRAGAKRIIAVGGDGTLNEVVNGFFEGHHPAPKDCALGVLMSGTGGDFRRVLGWPKDLAKELECIRNGVARWADVGVVTAQNSHQEAIRRYFINCASVGLSAQVAERVAARNALKNRWAYLKETLRAFFTGSPTSMLANVDGQEHLWADVTLLAFANATHFGGGMKIAPHAKIDDGHADIMLAQALTPFYALMSLPRVYFGGHLSLRRIQSLRAKQLTLKAHTERRVQVECDGEPCGFLPAQFEILPGAILLIQST